VSAAGQWSPAGSKYERGLRAVVELDMPELEDALLHRLRARLDPVDQGWLSVKGAATYLDSTPPAVRQLIRRGHLRAYK
jgi:hypothetical protein